MTEYEIAVQASRIVHVEGVESPGEAIEEAKERAVAPKPTAWTISDTSILATRQDEYDDWTEL